MRKASFPPVVDTGTRVLILGSLPGDASLAAAQYYAHPRNQFWRLLGVVAGGELAALPYPQRLATMQALGVGLWDVVAEATRSGSLDSAIRDARANPLAALVATLPALQAVAFNGQTAGKAAPVLAGCGVDVLVLPSSSPAHTLAFDKKLQEWQALRRYMV
ncbi:DNA-deoxyinosine glycosylase [Vogesella sp. XCS3]|uniref:DNA-deoxyinosine glycosylase n=1 Tax=Vogesella sp. XCS3 TaxID=2877939 RepID=UPI001D0B506B|nr:DNA-deoxyinosine glycosylase [Vogesella sp. XCS3]UDM17836.1 DNA-deoxyinosine glycosylase [Vogesella sp. XCS3]